MKGAIPDFAALGVARKVPAWKPPPVHSIPQDQIVSIHDAFAWRDGQGRRHEGSPDGIPDRTPEEVFEDMATAIEGEDPDAVAEKRKRLSQIVAFLSELPDKIKAAFMGALLEADEEITVRELAERSGVSRPTLYAHVERASRKVWGMDHPPWFKGRRTNGVGQAWRGRHPSPRQGSSGRGTFGQGGGGVPRFPQVTAAMTRAGVRVEDEA